MRNRRKLLGSGGYCSDARAFFSRVSGLTTAHKKAYNKLIRDLISAGVWTTLDVLYIFATANSATALTNLKSSSFGGTASGSPTFSVNAGYTGTDASSTVYIDTGFNPSSGSPSFTQNSNHLSIWANTN